MQLSKGLAGVSKEEMSRIVIAYEPVWAIGTGLTATPEAAQVCVCERARARVYRIIYVSGFTATPEGVHLCACACACGEA